MAKGGATKSFSHLSRPIAQCREATSRSWLLKKQSTRLAAQFDRTPKAFEYRMQNISAVFDELVYRGYPPKTCRECGHCDESYADPTHSGKTPGMTRSQAPRTSRNWEKALAAVEQLGGSASRKQVEAWILAREPDSTPIT